MNFRSIIAPFFITLSLQSINNDYLAQAFENIAKSVPKIKTAADLFSENIQKLENIIVTDNVDLSAFKKEIVLFLQSIKATTEGNLDITEKNKNAALEYFLGTDYVNEKVLKKHVIGYAGLNEHALRIGYTDDHLKFLWETSLLLNQINPKIMYKKDGIPTASYTYAGINNLKNELKHRSIEITEPLIP